MRKALLSLLFFIVPLWSNAQIGDHRNDLSIGLNAGLSMTNVGFVPKVTQTMLPGYTAGLSLRYVCEKYFSTICSVFAELNYTQMGWREDIRDLNSAPVFNKTTGSYEKYDHILNYIQLPALAHLAWGNETKGFNFFIEAGPQFGYFITDKVNATFTKDNANIDDRANKTIAQVDMAVENKFDYGIAAGIGVEYSVRGLGHFLLSGRYYYGLANIYGASKSDYFAKSNHNAIQVRLSYLIDLTKTKH